MSLLLGSSRLLGVCGYTAFVKRISTWFLGHRQPVGAMIFAWLDKYHPRSAFIAAQELMTIIPIKLSIKTLRLIRTTHSSLPAGVTLVRSGMPPPFRLFGPLRILTLHPRIFLASAGSAGYIPGVLAHVVLEFAAHSDMRYRFQSCMHLRVSAITMIQGGGNDSGRAQKSWDPSSRFD
ncbi:uncharacterized protein BT62DRAFT_1001982 [Guyanagaster necrorhizus]|uniref:Uncharacterized protein n=1 Tax=Guyanagaster necrorhizus TaxID=856835 RepID=A0A9P8AW17_9AGAR|nr:uncharacterized protein BT62DRAFT_1001982 [Guyanagaster necrorhizus MCA 3950]KAG7449691.1 hypothetical protein BT62DRAFT_1001982 [Guyanagaster necrorhizus MCA 3950]